MKTIAPCCERAKRRAIVEGEGVCLLSLGNLRFIQDAEFCPWCGKRFEIVEAK